MREQGSKEGKGSREAFITEERSIGGWWMFHLFPISDFSFFLEIIFVFFAVKLISYFSPLNRFRVFHRYFVFVFSTVFSGLYSRSKRE